MATVGLIGKKCGMTRVFTSEGATVPVTIIEVKPNRVVQIKTPEKDGYPAIKITRGSKKASRINKPIAGIFAKAQVEAGEGFWEFQLAEDELKNFKVGSEVNVDTFAEGQSVDVTGISKGKGFAGVIKRYHFACQDATHGNSLSHRAPGSIGQRQTPGRVFKGKKMAGHLGNVKRTIQSLEVVKVDKERNLILIKGGVPGAPNGYVMIKSAIKKRGKANGA